MKHILIIEDEFIIAKDLQLLLKSNTTNVTIARNYNQALQAFDPKTCNLIICDINLNNDKDGIETITALQKKGTAPVVYLTAYNSADIIERAKKTMPFAYLLKPYKESQLKITIDLAILNYKKQQENVEEVADYTKKLKALTHREREILIALASGKTSKEAGESLFISTYTVETHKRNIKKKLELHTLNELIRFTMNTNLYKVS